MLQLPIMQKNLPQKAELVDKLDSENWVMIPNWVKQTEVG